MSSAGSSAGKARPERFLDRLGVRHPIFQAPMGGGPTTPALVAAVSNAGGLGWIAAGYLSPDELGRQIREVRLRTDRPFGVNAFAGGATEGARDAAPMRELLARWSTALGIEPERAPEDGPESEIGASRPGLESVVEVVLENGVAVFSVTFGVPERGLVDELRSRNVVVMGTATTVEEAAALAEAGVDAVVAQGAEAGAHRGTFSDAFDDGLVGTMVLVPRIVDMVGRPVVASGGIMDGRGIAAARALGAAAVQMGTAFLVTEEADVPQAWRARLLGATESDTTLTRAFSGRPARAIRNRFVTEVEESGVPIPPYPLQNELTRPLRRAAAAAGDAEALSLWAGQGVAMARAMPAGRLVEVLVKEMEATLASL